MKCSVPDAKTQVNAGPVRKTSKDETSRKRCQLLAVDVLVPYITSEKLASSNDAAAHVLMLRAALVSPVQLVRLCGRPVDLGGLAAGWPASALPSREGARQGNR